MLEPVRRQRRVAYRGRNAPVAQVQGSVILTTKTDQIRAAWAAGDRIGALRIAACFFDRSAATKAFRRGMDAHNNPQFYRQLGKDPELLIGTALGLLAQKFRL